MRQPSSLLKVLQVHNRHAPGWGGEETVVNLEFQLLQKRGHEVEQFQISNAVLKQASTFRQMLAAPATLWSHSSYRKLRQKIGQFQPHVVHVHNTFPLFSPSIFWAASRAGVPVVYTLHNFRSACANAVLFRAERPCEDCVGGVGWSGLRHKCYSNSLLRTAAVTAMNTLHRFIGTYANKIDAYVALNSFSQDVFVRSGLPSQKVIVKANFVPESTLRHSTRSPQIVFVGSMMRHKGIHLLLEAWKRVNVPEANLLLLGDGPERSELQKHFNDVPSVSWAGSLSHQEVLQRICRSRALVLPTLVYENCPMVLLEAFAEGTPVIVPDLPSMKTFVNHDREGLLYRAGDISSLAEALTKALVASEDAWSAWSTNCRTAHARHYNETTNYQQLISIYNSVIKPRASVTHHEKNSSVVQDVVLPVEANRL